MNINLDYPYKIKQLSKEDGGGFFIEYPDLPGCFSDGETIEEAIENGKDAVKCYVETAIEDNDPIPEPFSYQNVEKYSGKFQLRIPKSLHKKLIEKSQEEGVSLNQLITTYVSVGVGEAQGRHGYINH